MNQNKKAQDIFHAALAIDSATERKDYLETACAESPELRKQVEGLLVAYGLAGSFLERPASEPFPSTNDPTDNVHLEPTQFLKPKLPSQAEVGTDSTTRRIGDYELIERIASGGMGVVYKARQISLNRIVAIKMILAGQFASEDEVQRFHREAEAAGHLDHPGIVPVFDVGSFEDQHFFSMGFVNGKSLAAKLKDGPMSPRVAAMYVKKIAIAAHYAHEHGVIHRDLKPGNVLLDENGEPRITDFGLAKRIETDSHLTATGMVMGTPCYIPPEQASGKIDQVTAASDVYSLGAILYALLTGQPPFDATNSMETLLQVLEDEPVRPRQIVAEIPKDIEAICLKCLEKDPGDRYQTAAELAAELQLFLAGDPIQARNDMWRRFRKWSLREPVLAAHLGAIAVMMTMVVLNYVFFGRHTEEGMGTLILNESILGAWALFAVLLQRIHNAIASETLMPMIWAATNPLFLTVALAANQPPRAALLSSYFLLIVTAGFFRRVELVVITTISTLVGYLGLLIFFPETEPGVSPPSYHVIFAASLTIAGGLLSYQVLRLKRLSQKDVM